MAKTKKISKFIRVLNDEFDEVNRLLSDGWQVEKMTAGAAGGEYNRRSYCYVLLTKKITTTDN